MHGPAFWGQVTPKVAGGVGRDSWVCAGADDRIGTATGSRPRVTELLSQVGSNTNPALRALGA
jgi:hypothetical protein